MLSSSFWKVQKLLRSVKSLFVLLIDRIMAGWRVVGAYQQADELAAEDISSKRLEDVFKSVEQTYRQKRKREED